MKPLPPTFKIIKDVKAHFQGSYDDFREFEDLRRMHVGGYVLAPLGVLGSGLVFFSHRPAQSEKIKVFTAAAAPYQKNLPQDKINEVLYSDPLAHIVNNAINNQEPANVQYNFKDGVYTRLEIPRKTAKIDAGKFNQKVHAGIEQTLNDFSYETTAVSGFVLSMAFIGAGLIGYSHKKLKAFQAKHIPHPKPS